MPQSPDGLFMVRVAKALVVMSMALYLSLIAFGNITDYNTNFVFVQKVMRMEEVPATSAAAYRAILEPALHHAVYLFIIAIETVAAVLLWWGGAGMLRRSRAAAAEFVEGKRPAVLGLLLVFLLGHVVFLSGAVEWFQMWMASSFNAGTTAFQMFITALVALIFVAMPDA